MALKFGKFELSIIRESVFKLDGGAMFGVVPKTMWGKLSPADELNRVVLACNLLLIDTGAAKVLIETGMGDRWSDKERERYGLETLVSPEHTLDGVGLKPKDIDFVIISHLHFDHAGGATISKDGAIVPTYPNAKYVVQRGEWDFAFKANARAKASYRPDDFVPIEEHKQLVLVDGDYEVTPESACVLPAGIPATIKWSASNRAGKKAFISPTSCRRARISRRPG